MEYKYQQTAGALQEASETTTHDGPPPADFSQMGTSVQEATSPLPLLSRQELADWHDRTLPKPAPAHDLEFIPWRRSTFFLTVPDGMRMLRTAKDGTVSVVVGPKRLYVGGAQFVPMHHYTAHPGEFLIVRFRDGRQTHLPGPADVWFDPRVHRSIEKEDCLPIASREAVVVYSPNRAEGASRAARGGASETREETSPDAIKAREEELEPDVLRGPGEITRRIVYGPASFVPEPGEWLHTFSWHGSKGGAAGFKKVPNALVFQKLWLLPDQMYHDVSDVRTADDAVLMIRLMIFFELVDAERMLETTHDPIGDFVNAATADLVEFVGQRSFEGFKADVSKLNELGTYAQLVERARQCGYRINKVVYRGYGAPPSLQQMHDQAIESRTRLAHERATEQQAQELEDFRLERTLARATMQREEKAREVEQAIAIERRELEAELEAEQSKRELARLQAKLDAEQAAAVTKQADEVRRAHLEGLAALGVDLTKYLTQGRADQLIEVRGAATPHVHLEGGPG